MARWQVQRILIGVALCALLVVVWKSSRGFNLVDPSQQRTPKFNQARNLALLNNTPHNQVMKASTQVRSESVENTIANIHNPTAKPLDPVSGDVSTGGQRSNSQGRVIVMSYIRSGSTFTGDLFQSSPDVFYLYEPLLYTLDVDVLKPNTSIRDRLNHHFKRDVPNPPETEDYLTSMLACNITLHKLSFLEGISRSKMTSSFQKCKSRGSNGNNCLRELISRCQKSQVVLAKVLRLRMWEIERLLSLDPILKIIHLVRDPRGMMASRMESSSNIDKAFPDFCNRLKDDANYSVTVERKFPDRILTVRYEDLASRPVDITKVLYQFAGVEWTSKIRDQVLKRTNPSNKDFTEQKFGTMRKNSSLTAFQWRKKLDFAKVKKIQGFCEKPMERYGFIPFASAADMLNDSLSAIMQDYSNDYNKASADN